MIYMNKPLQESRGAVRLMLNARTEDRLVFTSSGTECDNRAIDIALDLYRQRMGLKATNFPLPHVVTTAIEHPAILGYLEALCNDGLIELSVAKVNSAGVVSVDNIVASVRHETALVTVMHSNNEVGSIQPISDICRAIKQRNASALVHTDAAQSIGNLQFLFISNKMSERYYCGVRVGKTFVDVQEMGVDMLTVVGHKFGAPKGVGVLYIKHGVE